MIKALTKQKAFLGIISKVKNLGAVYYVLILIFVTTSIVEPDFFRWRAIRNLLVQSTALGIASIGQTLVLLAAGIDLSVGAVISMTNSIAAATMKANRLDLILIVIICISVGILVGLINGYAIAYLKFNPLIFTIAIGTIIQGLSFEVLYMPGGYVSHSFQLISTGAIGPIPLPAIYLLLLYFIGTVILKKTRYGLSVYAVGGNSNSARLSGIRNKRVLLSVYVICSTLAALTGLFLAARIGSGDPLVGDPFTLDTVTAAAIGGTSLFGGVGNLPGTLAGVLIIGTISTGLNMNNISPFYQWIVKGLVLIVALAVDYSRRNR